MSYLVREDGRERCLSLPSSLSYNPMFLYLDVNTFTCLRTQESKIQLRSKATWAEVRDSNLTWMWFTSNRYEPHEVFSFIAEVLIINFCNLPGSVHSSPVTDRIRFIPGLVWGHWADEKAVSKMVWGCNSQNFVRWYVSFVVKFSYLGGIELTVEMLQRTKM